MNRTNKNQIIPQHKKRLENISTMLREIRLTDGMHQDEYNDWGISRRQIQRSEYSNNMTLIRLFQILDLHGYTLQQFFAEIE